MTMKARLSLVDFTLNDAFACRVANGSLASNVFGEPPMREILFILALVVTVTYCAMNPNQVDSAVNWAMGLFHR